MLKTMYLEEISQESFDKINSLIKTNLACNWYGENSRIIYNCDDKTIFDAIGLPEEEQKELYSFGWIENFFQWFKESEKGCGDNIEYLIGGKWGDSAQININYNTIIERVKESDFNESDMMSLESCYRYVEGIKTKYELEIAKELLMELTAEIYKINP